MFVSVTVVTPISIHAPARGATLSFQATGVNPVYFNPRSREGSDASIKRQHHHSTYFNPRSREGSDCRSLFRFSRSCDFNPRSREGSDVRNLTQHSGRIFISIHAPARGATRSGSFPGPQLHIFQSTLPRGERQNRIFPKSSFTLISIHAPARGATSRVPLYQLAAHHFNPRSREGSDSHLPPQRQ